MQYPYKRTIFQCALLCLLTIFFSADLQTVFGQGFDRIERQRTKDMLRAVKGELKKNYYDANFHNVNIEETFKAAEEKIDKATTTGQAYGIIAQTLINLNDSHTSFIPPNRVFLEYGWRMRMIGDKCFITGIKPKSDAEAKGLKVGDEIISIEGFKPNRKEMWKVMYYYNLLSPRLGLHLTVQGPNDKAPRELDIASKERKLPRIADLTDSSGIADYIRELENSNDIDFHRFVKIGTAVVWKPVSFGFDPKQVSSIVEQFRGSSTVIFDFRGNPGGYVVTLEKLVGFLFEKDLKIADVKYRNKTETQGAKTEGKSVYKGKIIVLIDHNSGSAAEIFARLMQLEKRGIVIGDVSAGAVMQSRTYGLEAPGLGGNRVIPYAVSITNADVIMSDGKSLEYTGVTPDEYVIPTALDIANGRDPVLVKAISLAGGSISPEDAGKLFPIQWIN